MIPIIRALGGNLVGKVTLSGEVQADSGGGTPRFGGFQFNTDGTLDEVTPGGGLLQIDAATDWIIPNSAAKSSYEVRYTGLSFGFPGDGASFETDDFGGVDTYVDMSSNRLLRIKQTATGHKQFTCTFEIRQSGGPNIDTGSFTGDALVLP